MLTLISQKSIRFRILISKFGFIFFSILTLFILITKNVHSLDITLAWNANIVEDLTGFRVFYHDNANDYNYNNPVWEGNVTTCTIYNLDDTTTYFFVVRAFDILGNETDNSNEVRYSPTENSPPVVEAGPNQTVTLPDSATLDGSVTDDGLPNPPSVVTTSWSKVSGTGTVTFTDASLVDTTASFSESGTYVLRLTANDGELIASDDIMITVNNITPGNEDGLIGWWRFDEMDGTIAYDSSSNGNDGQLYGPIWTLGKVTGGLEFDGIDDNVEVGTFDVVGSGITISAWINADMYDHLPYHDARIISKSIGAEGHDHYWMLSTIKSGEDTRLRFRLKTGGSTTTLIASSGDLTTGVWIHAAAVYDGNTMKLYKDGKLVGSTTKTGIISTNNSASVNIGRNPDGLKPWNGMIDDVRVYNYALSEAEILELTNPVENYAPVANSQSLGTDENTALSITLTGSDVEGDNLTYVVVTQPSHGVLSGTAPNLTYTPDTDYVGSDSFSFKVNDGVVDSNTINVSITIYPVEDSLVDCTIYEDAEDGNFDGWIVYDEDPTDVWIANVFDADRQSRVIELGSVSRDYLYSFGKDWKNSKQFLARWSMKYSNYFEVYFDLHTPTGNIYLYYTPIDFDELGDGNYVHQGLGSWVIDGQWYSFERNLQADLEEAQPGVRILKINAFMVYGGGRVDDIELCDTN